ncbi:MAG: gfo/Idh/MocA family oxidoreductase [Planctomycetota bacterium]|nr:MAG: gfo/Idh/MocA family oxidoreductase [Planctomycetota bacterium]
MPSSELSRRRFLQSSAALAAALPLAGCQTPTRRRSPNERLHLGVIGVANRGTANLNGVASETIVALCDVDSRHLGQAAARFPDAAQYHDFRRMLERTDLDAVVISTPDHTHAVAALAAMDAGLDVYCEKPLAHNLEEVRRMTVMARRKRRITQMGIQIHAGENYRRVVEKIQSGLIGRVEECHVWVGKSWWADHRPEEAQAIPDSLHWDLWLGPAPACDYHAAYHPAGWRRYWEFGGGTLADMGCHHMDLAHWALDLEHPAEIEAEGPPVHPEGAPQWQIVHYRYPSRGPLGRRLPAVQLHWYHGGKRPPQFQEEGLLPSWGDGVLFIGSKGMLLSDYGRHVLLPEEKFQDVTVPEPYLASSPGHHQEWIQACKSREKSSCDFSYSGPLSEAALLGNLAYRMESKIDWNWRHQKAGGLSEAEALISRQARPGWQF